MSCSSRGTYFNTIDTSSCTDNNGYFTPYANAVSLNSRSGRLLGGMLPHVFPPKMEKARSVADIFATPADRLYFDVDNYTDEFNTHTRCGADHMGYNPYQQYDQTNSTTPITDSTDLTKANDTPVDTPIDQTDLSATDQSEISGTPQINDDGSVNVSTPADPLTTNKAVEKMIYTGNKTKLRPGGKNYLNGRTQEVYRASSKRSQVPNQKENYLTTELAGMRTVLVNGKENYELDNPDDQNWTITVCAIIMTIFFVIITLYLMKELTNSKLKEGAISLSGGNKKPALSTNYNWKPTSTPIKNYSSSSNKLSGGHIF